MKRLRLLGFFLALGILCHPYYVSAKEGFSWKVVSDDSGDKVSASKPKVYTKASADAGDDEDSDDEDDKEDNDDKDSDNENKDDRDDKDNDDADDKASDDKDNDDKDKKEADDRGSSDEDEDDNDSDDEEDDDEDERDDDAIKNRKKNYPNGKSIYSSSEIEEMIEDKYKERKEALAIEDPFKKTKAVDRINSFILNFADDPLKDKTLAFLGDSITAGNGGSLTLDGSGLNYTDYIAQYTDAKIINLGIGGAPYDGYDNDDAIIYRYEDIPENTDIIVLFAGINDLFAGSEHFGSLDKPKKGTYCGDTYTTFRGIHEDYPDAHVYVVITYPNKMEDYTQFTGENWQEYADVQIELADEFDYDIINLYQEGFLDSKDSKVRNSFFLDDIHPDDLGSEVLGRHILVHILKDYL